MEILGNLGLIIGGGFDTTTALTAHAWSGSRSIPISASCSAASATRCSIPPPRSSCASSPRRPATGARSPTTCEVEGHQFKEGERLWISWAMANRDPSVFEEPQRGRSWTERATGTSASASVCTAASGPTWRARCSSRCSPRCSTGCPTTSAIPRAPCTTTPSASSRACGTCRRRSRPGRRLGAGLDETLEKLQRICDEQELARPITERKEAAVTVARACCRAARRAQTRHTDMHARGRGTQS